MTSPRVPILMFHKVGAFDNGVSDPFINVTCASFSRQMRTMSRLGYRAITFADVVKGLSGVIPLHERCFAITFDDGYISVAEHAFQILDRYRFPATVFVVSDMVGRSNEWDARGMRPIQPLMDWDQLRTLHVAGWEIAAHTKTHPHLNQLHSGEAAGEIASSKQAIESHLGTAVETFCYPYGNYDKDTPNLVQEAGFLGACTTRSGLATASACRFLLPRVKISHSDNVAGLLYKLHLRPILPTLRSARYLAR